MHREVVSCQDTITKPVYNDVVHEPPNNITLEQYYNQMGGWAEWCSDSNITIRWVGGLSGIVCSDSNITIRWVGGLSGVVIVV